MVDPPPSPKDTPLVVLLGATGSGKTALALRLAEEFAGEIVSCDSVAVYRELEIGTAKPTPEERARVPHHMIDVASPDEACTAGDYARMARNSLAGIAGRGRLPLVAGGTGLYLRALIDGLFPAPPAREDLRERLRSTSTARGPLYLHRLLTRLDAAAALAIHPHDVSKMIRAIEVSLTAREPLTKQWTKGRGGLTGYRILRLGLNPPRELLYERINARAAAMFERGLVAETERLVARYGYACRPLSSLGYAQAITVLRGECHLDEAVRHAQQRHRNYAKRQGTWFRKEPAVHWLPGFGNDPGVGRAASTFLQEHINSAAM